MGKKIIMAGYAKSAKRRFSRFSGVSLEGAHAFKYTTALGKDYKNEVQIADYQILCLHTILNMIQNIFQ